MLQNCFLHLYIPQFQKCGLSDLQIQIFNKKITSISACGEGVLRLSKSEAITDMMASSHSGCKQDICSVRKRMHLSILAFGSPDSLEFWPANNQITLHGSNANYKPETRWPATPSTSKSIRPVCTLKRLTESPINSKFNRSS